VLLLEKDEAQAGMSSAAGHGNGEEFCGFCHRPKVEQNLGHKNLGKAKNPQAGMEGPSLRLWQGQGWEDRLRGCRRLSGGGPGSTKFSPSPGSVLLSLSHCCWALPRFQASWEKGQKTHMGYALIT